MHDTFVVHNCHDWYFWFCRGAFGKIKSERIFLLSSVLPVESLSSIRTTIQFFCWDLTFNTSFITLNAKWRGIIVSFYYFMLIWNTRVIGMLLKRCIYWFWSRTVKISAMYMFFHYNEFNIFVEWIIFVMFSLMQNHIFFICQWIKYQKRYPILFRFKIYFQFWSQD